MSVSCIALLYAISPLNKEIYRGEFNRVFMDDLVEKYVLDLEVNSFYLAGVSKSKIFLGNVTAPIHLLTSNHALLDTSHIRLTFNKIDSVIQPMKFFLQVDSPHFYVSHGMEPVILKGNVGNWIADPIVKDSAYFFVESVPVGPESFVLRSYSMKNNGYELGKLGSQTFSFHDDLLVKQIDGVFCVDGELHYADSIKKIVYVHFYRNEFIVADTSLSLEYRGRTIDPFDTAMIKVAALKDGKESMFKAPPSQVNGHSCVYGKYLFVQSRVLAKNENPREFINGATIDVYDITSGSYVKTFHVPHYKNEGIKSFQVFENKVFVISGNYLIRYDFSL